MPTGLSDDGHESRGGRLPVRCVRTRPAVNPTAQLPYPITADELTRMHGNDERVSVESLRQGTDMIYRTLVGVAGKAR